jgi:hypothetical protein
MGLMILLAGAGTAEAQSAKAGRAAFKKGLKDMFAGRYETACPALAEAYRLTSKTGALFTLAECEAKWGKLASSLGHYREYLKAFVAMSAGQRARQAKRHKIATKQVAALEGVVPKLTLVLAEDAPAGSIILLDGEVVPAEELGAAQEVDPGRYSVSLEVEGHPPIVEEVALEAGDSRTVELTPPRAPEPVAPPAAVVLDEDSTLFTWGLVVGAVGIAGVGVGAVTGLLAISSNDTRLERCEDLICDQEGKDAADDTKTFGTISTIGFSVGGAALVAGTVMLLLAPSDDGADGTAQWRLAPIAGSRGGGLVLELRNW